MTTRFCYGCWSFKLLTEAAHKSRINYFDDGIIFIINDCDAKMLLDEYRKLVNRIYKNRYGHDRRTNHEEKNRLEMPQMP